MATLTRISYAHALKHHPVQPFRYWKQKGENATLTRGEVIRSRLAKLRAESRCMRCTEKGHRARDCFNGLVCVLCNKLAHRANTCSATLVASPIKPPPDISSSSAPKPRSNPNPAKEPPEEWSMATRPVLTFHTSPGSEKLENAFRLSFFLSDLEGWGPDRLQRALSCNMPNHEWVMRVFEDDKYLIEAPSRFWLDSALAKQSLRLENKDVPIQAWDPSIDEGMRLIPVWVRIRRFPMKLWNFAEFEKLFDDMGGVVYDLDYRTANYLDWRFARVRVGICDPQLIPPFTWIKYRDPSGFVGRYDVYFEIENNGLEAGHGNGNPPPPPPRYGGGGGARMKPQAPKPTPKGGFTGTQGSAGAKSNSASSGDTGKAPMQVDGIDQQEFDELLRHIELERSINNGVYAGGSSLNGCRMGEILEITAPTAVITPDTTKNATGDFTSPIVYGSNMRMGTESPCSQSVIEMTSSGNTPIEMIKLDTTEADKKKSGTGNKEKVGQQMKGNSQPFAKKTDNEGVGQQMKEGSHHSPNAGGFVPHTPTFQLVTYQPRRSNRLKVQVVTRSILGKARSKLAKTQTAPKGIWKEGEKEAVKKWLPDDWDLIPLQMVSLTQMAHGLGTQAMTLVMAN